MEERSWRFEPSAPAFSAKRRQRTSASGVSNGASRHSRFMSQSTASSALAAQSVLSEPSAIPFGAAEDQSVHLPLPPTTSTFEEMSHFEQLEQQKEEKQEEHDAGLTARGELLRKAQNFKTFMEIMEEDPKFDMPYGDSFLYLSSRDGNPYDLRIVAHSEINPNDYYTLSYGGVTHFGTEGTSIFTALDQFEREHYLFTMISQLDFFRKFWKWKLFGTWYRNIRAQKMEVASAALSESLFILHPVLRDPLIEAYALAERASSLLLYKIEEERVYTLEEFCQAQMESADKVTSLLRHLGDERSSIIRTSCEDTLTTFLRENNFYSDDEPVQNMMGLMHAEEVRTVSFTERAAMRTQCRKLVRFIRLIDFFTLQSQLKLAYRSVQQLLHFIRETPESLRFDNGDEISSSSSSEEEEDSDGDEGDGKEDIEKKKKKRRGIVTVQNAASRLESENDGLPPLFMVEMDFEVNPDQLRDATLRFLQSRPLSRQGLSASLLAR